LFRQKSANCCQESSYSNSNPNLNYSQAVPLLGIPKEERAQFIIDMNIEGIPTVIGLKEQNKGKYIFLGE